MKQQQRQTRPLQHCQSVKQQKNQQFSCQKEAKQPEKKNTPHNFSAVIKKNPAQKAIKK